MFDTTTTLAVRAALAGLAARQRVTADNIANINTPGFLAGRVQFERALQTAIDAGQSPAQTTPVVTRSLEPTRADGNNVNLDHETLTDIDTNLRYQLMLHIIDGKLSGLRKVIGG